MCCRRLLSDLRLILSNTHGLPPRDRYPLELLPKRSFCDQSRIFAGFILIPHPARLPFSVPPPPLGAGSIRLGIFLFLRDDRRCTLPLRGGSPVSSVIGDNHDEILPYRSDRGLRAGEIVLPPRSAFSRHRTSNEIPLAKTSFQSCLVSSSEQRPPFLNPY